jgi:hypothetical protein
MCCNMVRTSCADIINYILTGCVFREYVSSVRDHLIALTGG